MSRFAIQCVELNGTQMPGTVGQQINRGRRIESDGSDGTVHQTLHHIMQTEPMAELSSLALKSWITALTGASAKVPMVALNGSTGLSMYAAKSAAAAPGYAGGTTHLRRRAANGLVFAEGIRWAQGQYASLNLRALFRSTAGGTDPFGADTLVALPTQPVPTEKFVLSALVLNALSFPDVTDLEIAIDPKFAHDYDSGLPYPVDIVGAGARGHLEVVLRATVGAIDAAEGTGSVSAVFTKVAQGATLGAETVTLTLNSPWTIEETRSDTQGQYCTRQLVARTRFDGTNEVLAWGTT